MDTLNSSDARTKWSSTFDEAFYQGPKLIEKGDRVNILLSGPMLSNWLSNQHPLNSSHTVEEDIHLVNLVGIPDIFGYGSTLTEALGSLYEHLTELTREMFADFARFSKERPSDVPYLLQLSMLDTEEAQAQIAVTING